MEITHWQAPSNVLTTGWEDWSLFLANDPYFWESSEGHKKRPPWATKMIFFTRIYFFSRGHTLDSCFLQKTHSFWSSIASRALCRKKTAYRGSPPRTIFLTSSEQRNIVQLCTSTSQAPKSAMIGYDLANCKWNQNGPMVILQSFYSYSSTSLLRQES